MRYLSILLLLSMGFLLTNCSTSQPLIVKQNNPNYAKSYKTQLVRANFSYELGGLGNSAAIQYQAQLSCKIMTCGSPRIILSFYLVSGSSQVRIGNHRNLIIKADDKSYHWSRQNSANVQYGHASLASGRLVGVKISESVFKRIAESKNVSGVLAGQHFQWTFRNRKSLRALLKKLDNGSSM